MEPGLTNCCPKRLSFLDRYLTAWIFLAIVVGVALAAAVGPLEGPVMIGLVGLAFSF